MALGRRPAGRKPSARELLLAASVFHHSPQGIMITDAERRIRMVNAAFTQITGWREARVLGRRDAMLSAGRDDPGLGKQMHVCAGCRWHLGRRVVEQAA